MVKKKRLKMSLALIQFLHFAICTQAIENLALGRPAWQNHDWPNKETDWGAAKAVDGKYTDRGVVGNQCTISNDKQQTAEWRVDLERVVSISQINIYYRTDNAPIPSYYTTRFAGFFLYVSNTTSKDNGHLCFHEIQTVSGTPVEDQRINCSLYGRYVIYYNERRSDVTYPSYYSPYAFNDLCELEVYGCPVPGYYGEYCNQTCPNTCPGQQCDAVTGNCVNGCLQGYQGPHCSYFNLALRRHAWQQNNFPGKETDWGADKAVDGKYTDRSAGGNQCTQSAVGKQTATLRVDLGRVVSISHIRIFYRTDNTPSPGAYYNRFAGFFLYVSNTTVKDDGYLCFHEIQTVNGTPTENQTISCPVHGRYVIYYNERRPGVTYPSYYSQYAYNELCELEVYGCPDQRYFGEYCDQLCPENCQEQRCDITTGECLGCKPGYQGRMCSHLCGKQMYGLECSLSCGNCSDGETCHHVNGTCLTGCSEGAEGETCQTACQPGYYGKDCIHECSVNCGVTRRCNRYTGECEGGCQPGWKRNLCEQECDAGMHGSNCSQRCGYCLNNTKCHHSNGSCFDGCSAGYHGLLCSKACQPGYYGKDCVHKCSIDCGLPNRCNSFTGQCEGGCQPGWKGNLCDQECDAGMHGSNCGQRCGYCLNNTKCHHSNGTCFDGCSAGYHGLLCSKECVPGFYGKDCRQNCSKSCGVSKRCDRFTGHCEGGCQPGWQGIQCDKKCGVGLYGVNCNQTCGHCLNDSQCHHVNGSCLEGCSSGYEGSLCMKVCGQSYWGENCKRKCHADCINQICHHESGVCKSYVKVRMESPSNKRIMRRNFQLSMLQMNTVREIK